MRIIRITAGILALMGSAPVFAQIAPTPSFEDPRLQTVTYEPGQSIRLVVFPESSLKLVLERGEAIERVVVSDGAAFRAAVVGSGDTVEVAPLRPNATAELRLATAQRQYNFLLHTGSGLTAAYVVRMVPPEGGTASAAPLQASQPEPGAELVEYRLKGDRIIRPDGIFDDGQRTYISWHRDKALPAIFGVGPGGGEEIVAGYMRDGRFVIDRIYPELVFRFDKATATARRQTGKKK